MNEFMRAIRAGLVLTGLVLLATRTAELCWYAQSKRHADCSAQRLQHAMESISEKARSENQAAGTRPELELKLGTPLVAVLGRIRELAASEASETPSLSVHSPSLLCGPETGAGIVEHRIEVSLAGAPRSLMAFAEAISAAEMPIRVDTLEICDGPPDVSAVTDPRSTLRIALRLLVE